MDYLAAIVKVRREIVAVKERRHQRLVSLSPDAVAPDAVDASCLEVLEARVLLLQAERDAETSR